MADINNPTDPEATTPDTPDTPSFDQIDWAKGGHSKFAGVDEQLRLDAFESQFRDAYDQHAEQHGLDTDPDSPQQQYDYRSAFLNGDLKPDGTGHLPSQYKMEGHKDLILPAGEVYPKEVIDSGFLELDTVDGMGPAQRVPINPDTPFDTRTSRPAMKDGIDRNRELQPYLNAEARGLRMPNARVRGALQERFYADNPDMATELRTSAKNRQMRKFYEKNGYIWDPELEENRFGRDLEPIDPQSEMGPLSPEQELERTADFDKRDIHRPQAYFDTNHQESVGVGESIKEALISLGDPMSNSDARIADRHMARLQGSTQNFIATLEKNVKSDKGRNILKQFEEVGQHKDLAYKSGFSLEGAYVAAGLGALNWTNTMQALVQLPGIIASFGIKKGAEWLGDEETAAIADSALQVMIDDVAARSARFSEESANIYAASDSDFFIDIVSLLTEIGMDLISMGATAGTRILGGKAATQFALKQFGEVGKKGTKAIDQLMFTAQKGGPSGTIAKWAIQRRLRRSKHGLADFMDVTTDEGASLFRAAMGAGEISKKGGIVQTPYDWLANQLSKPRAGYNPFVSRMFGNATANSLVAADERARANGESLSWKDIGWSLMDGTNMAVATWMLHATGTIPKKFGIERGKGLFDGIPKSLRQAVTTSTLRSAKYGVQGGLGFLAYEAMIDGWHFATTEADGRRSLIDKFEIIELFNKAARLSGKAAAADVEEYGDQKIHGSRRV